MAHDEALLGRVRALLSHRTDVVERRMMGGMCVMVGGHVCCGASGNRLMVRVGRDVYESVLLEPHVRPLDLGGRRPVGFVLVEQEGFAAAADLRRWIECALATVAALPARAQSAIK